MVVIATMFPFHQPHIRADASSQDYQDRSNRIPTNRQDLLTGNLLIDSLIRIGKEKGQINQQTVIPKSDFLGSHFLYEITE